MFEIEFADEFEVWWDSLTAEEQDAVARVVGLLEAKGIALGFPHSSQVNGSKHGAMRELRVQQAGRPYRVFYIFSPERNALLLIGGDKGSLGNDRFYAQFTPRADAIYDAFLVELAREREPPG